MSEYKFSSKTHQAQLMMVKFTLEQVTKAHNGSRCILYSFTSGKETQYSLYSRMDGPQDWPGKVQKILPPPGCDPWTIQAIASCYTDYTIQAHKHDSYMRQVIAFESLAKN